MYCGSTMPVLSGSKSFFINMTLETLRTENSEAFSRVKDYYSQEYLLVTYIEIIDRLMASNP